MTRRRFLYATVLLGVLIGQPWQLFALPVTGLYSHRVAVANESDAERQRAFREALEAVILKVTGDPRWLEHPVVTRAVGNAQSLVEAISYSSELIPVPETAGLQATGNVQVPTASGQEPSAAGQEPSASDQEPSASGQEPSASDQEPSASNQQPPASGQEPLAAGQEPAGAAEDSAASGQATAPQSREQRYIDVSFADNLIDGLLADADIPVWDSNRPSVLVWMVLQDPDGDRQMLTADSHPEIMSLLQDFAARRGVPIIFPLLDFEDRRNLGVDQVWALETEAIRAASARYGADSVLAGRVLFTAGGEMVGLWQFLFQDQEDVFDGFDANLEDYLFAPLDRITSQLAGYFAITPETTLRQQVALRIDGVGDLQAYSALLNYVSNLGLVESVVTTGLEGARIELNLDLLGNAQQLNELIALDRDLLPVSSAGGVDVAGEPESDMLHYRWTR